MAKIVYEEIELDLDAKLIDPLCKIALEKIKDDKPVLLNYIVNIVLKDVIDNPDKYKKLSELAKESEESEDNG